MNDLRPVDRVPEPSPELVASGRSWSGGGQPVRLMKLLWAEQADAVERLRTRVATERLITSLRCQKCGRVLAELLELADDQGRIVATTITVLRPRLAPEPGDSLAAKVSQMRGYRPAFPVSGSIPRTAGFETGILRLAGRAPAPSARREITLRCDRHGDSAPVELANAIANRRPIVRVPPASTAAR